MCPQSNRLSCQAYLKQTAEQVPNWLGSHQVGQKLNLSSFFGSRVVYYPGSGLDGDAVKLFASSNSAHCFVYADYGLNKESLEQQLDSAENGFRGYTKLDRIKLSQEDILPKNWVQHIDPSLAGNVNYSNASEVINQPFAFLEILERKAEFDESHGAKRIAILFLGADGFATYDALFCQSASQPLFALVLQDHGFGGNYARFDNKGLLHGIAQKTQKFPKYLWVDPTGTKPWEEYQQIENVAFAVGGMHNNERYLFERK